MSEYQDMTHPDRHSQGNGPLNAEVVKDLSQTIRQAKDRRQAVDQQAPPTGDGAIVLDAVLDRIAELTGSKLLDWDKAHMLSDDLKARSEMGEKKYGTKLRTDNGRNPLVDLYQELQDAIMYSMQGRLHGDTFCGIYVELLLRLGEQVAGELNRRG